MELERERKRPRTEELKPPVFAQDEQPLSSTGSTDMSLDMHKDIEVHEEESEEEDEKEEESDEEEEKSDGEEEESDEEEKSDEEEESDKEEEEEEEEEESDEEFYETINILLMAALSVVIAVMGIFGSIHSQHIERPLIRPSVTRSGYENIHRVLNDDPESFRHMYRMHPDVFQKLCRIIREKTPIRDTRFICVEEMLATFLFIVGQNSRYGTIRDSFGRSSWTINKNFKLMLRALNTIAPQMMATPGTTTPAKIKDSSRFYPYFKDCIGVIDFTHIPTTVSGCDVSVYCNRQGTVSQNVLAACNFDLEFIYVLSGWEGSAHDSRVLHDAITRRQGLKIPQGKFYLVDCGFPNQQQFLAPFCGIRYQLQDFVGEGHGPEKAVELFNLRHASLRNVTERIFGIFKSRFSIFKSAPPFSYRTQAEIVLACAGLHNFLRKECRSDEFPIEQDDDPSSLAPLPIDLGDNGEPVFQTQDQQHEEANEWRAGIANDMWRDVGHNGNYGNLE